ncbi:MAG: DUF2812 domain-containing protein [Firmicutes bacterium]|nr:DUF2812 domain-containing protein [Bacillota bacterium]
MVNIFAIADIKNQEQYYKKQAANGKILTKFGVITKFKPCEPCEKQFFVDILPKSDFFGFFSKREKPAATVYRERWLAAGWDCAAKNGRFYVFSADKDVPLPSYISVADQLETLIDCSLKHEIVPIVFSMLAMIISFNGLFGLRERIFIDNNLILAFFNTFIMFLLAFWQLCFSLIWYIKAKIAIKKESPPPKVSAIASKIRYTVLAIWLLLGVPFILGQAILTPSNIIFDDNVHQAVRLADFGAMNATQISQLTTFQSNVFVPTVFRHLEGNFSGSNVTTDIYQANFTFVADFLYKNAVQNLLLFSQRSGTTILHLEQSAASLWAADTGILAYSDNDFWVILRKNNTIISVSTVIVNRENVETFELADFQDVVAGFFRRLLYSNG